MKKYQILYDWAKAEISRLSEDELAGQYSETLDPGRELMFASLTEDIRGLLVALTAAEVSRTHFSHWMQLHQKVSHFAEHFSDFPGFNFGRLDVFFVLSETLSATGVALDEEEVDDQLFEIRPLTLPLSQKWMVRENRVTFENSLVVISGDDVRKFEQELRASAGRISPKLVFHVLAALVCSQNSLSQPAALVKRVQPQISIEIVEAFVHLHIIAEGKSIHTPRTYTSQLQIGDFDSVDSSLPYHQWAESFVVLSEYNSRTEPLLKFLTIYHVIENLMIKRPLVELESRRNGKMFTLRSFKQMYEKVQTKELPALEKLFNSVLPTQINGTTTIGQSITTRWSSIQPHAVAIDGALSDLEMNKTHANLLTSNGAPTGFAALVYRTRCAIVHNKETEFHLTYSTMTSGFITIIEDFLLPALEELCFVLISKKNSLVWYSNQDLKLY